MQKRRDFAVRQIQLIRDKILNSYLDTIEDSFQENHSRFKLINYGTGSGKTHQLFEAICQTIEKHPDVQTIGIYVAPLREHLSVPSQVKEKYLDIPVYKLNSREMKTTDKYLKLYKNWTPLILNNKDIWKIDLKKISREKLDEARQNIQGIPNTVTRLKFVQRFEFGDKKVQEKQTDKVRDDLISRIEKFLVLVVLII